METINSILNLITINCLMTEMDIKGVYCSILIFTEHQVSSFYIT